MTKRKVRTVPAASGDLYAAALAIAEALESGEYLRGGQASRNLGKAWADAPYLSRLRAALAQSEPLIADVPDDTTDKSGDSPNED